MAYYIVQCPGCGSNGLGVKDEPSSKSCIPCGKLNNPAPSGETEFARLQRLGPLVQMLEDDRNIAFRVKMENNSEMRKISALAKFRTGVNMEEKRMDLERRSDRLKRLMEDEMFTYSQEMMSNFEQRQNSKIDEMRDRVTMLRGKREAEELKLVEKKLDQAFQNQCEQMRDLLTEKLRKDIIQDWGEQVKMKQRLRCEEEETDRMYAHLRKVDADNKLQREQANECMRAEATRKGLEELEQQMKYKQAKAADLGKIRARELAMDARVRKEMEDEAKKREEEKDARFIRAKEHVKDMLETRNYYRDRKVKREEIVAQEFLKKAVRELYIEQEDRNKAKREFLRSITIYLDYLKKQDGYNKSRESEVQELIDAMIEEQYLKVNESRMREQAQRNELLANVLAGRARQIEDLEAKRQREEMERQKELLHLKDEWKVYRREMEVAKEAEAAKRQAYLQDVGNQIKYQETIKERERSEQQREADLCNLEEGFLQNRLQKTLQLSRLEASNPYRQPLVGKPVKQVLRPL